MNAHVMARRNLGRARWLVVLLSALAIMVPSFASAAIADDEIGDSVWIGSGIGHDGTKLYPVFLPPIADPENLGEPDYWAYCIEHKVIAETNTEGFIGDASQYLGDNHFHDLTVQAKVLWVLAHSYPALTLEEFGIAAGVPSISQNDAIEATQYAIWRYTDLNFDADWHWESEESKQAYWYLVHGANASDGTDQPNFIASVSLDAPVAEQKPESLIGPFVLHTDRPAATVTVDPALGVVDESGDPIDVTSVIDNQEFFVDARNVTTSGTVTVQASTVGINLFGKILSVPTADGLMTEEEHAQTVILTAPKTKKVTAEVTVSWEAVAAPEKPEGTAPDGSKLENAPEQLANTGAEFQSTAFISAVGLSLLAASAVLLVRRVRAENR